LADRASGHDEVGTFCTGASSRRVASSGRKSDDYDWVYIAGGALLGGFTAHVWYPGFGPVVDGLNLVPALVGGVIGGAVTEVVYRRYIRRTQPT
jgi:outer membrane lipoprotein SlyB